MKQITLGILGGGQLGRMTALAAAPLGIGTHIFCPEGPNSPACQVTQHCTIAAYEDQASLSAFADTVDYITYEFENIPLDSVRYLETLKPVYPSSKTLEITQDRIKEKTFLNHHGIETTEWIAVDGHHDAPLLEDCILKTTRFGYDGKGQMRKTPDMDLQAILKQFSGQALIAELCIDFQCEISVIVVRSQTGDIKTYSPSVNEHKNHILHKSTAPAELPQDILDSARSIAGKVAHDISLIGVMGVEMFVTKDHELLVNELAPRPHNSGHWTIEACPYSQFENHVRSVCGLSLGSTKQHSPAIMLNLLGDDILDTDRYLNDPAAHLHVYGKDGAKEGRKMGHVTFLLDKS